MSASSGQVVAAATNLRVLQSFASGTPDPATGVAPFRVNPQGDGVCNSVDVAGVCHVDSLNVGVNAGGVIGYPGSISNLGLVSGRSFNVINSGTGNAPFAVDNAGAVICSSIVVTGGGPSVVQASIGSYLAPHVMLPTETITSTGLIVGGYFEASLLIAEEKIVELYCPAFLQGRTIGVTSIYYESFLASTCVIQAVNDNDGVNNYIKLSIKNTTVLPRIFRFTVILDASATIVIP